jgi:rsbT antagonist protein RsbS
MIAGLHLTRIGKESYLLEPSQALNIRDQARILEEIAGALQQEKAACLYYDLAGQKLIDQVYYAWLESLARTLAAINIRMVCIHMQPTAAFALSVFVKGKPCFETALDIPDVHFSARPVEGSRKS